MAKQVTVTLIDDVDEVPASETVRFGLDGRTYEIDLSDANANKLRRQLSGWIEHSRPAGLLGSGLGHGDSIPKRRGAADRAHSAAVRRWAKDHGYEISDRGRISTEVVQAYDAAN